MEGKKGGSKEGRKEEEKEGRKVGRKEERKEERSKLDGIKGTVRRGKEIHKVLKCKLWQGKARQDKQKD